MRGNAPRSHGVYLKRKQAFSMHKVKMMDVTRMRWKAGRNPPHEPYLGNTARLPELGVNLAGQVYMLQCLLSFPITSALLKMRNCFLFHTW